MGRVYSASGDDLSEVNAKIKELEDKVSWMSEDLNGVLVPGGTITFAELQDQEKKKLGYTYNISDAFTTTNEFREGAGHHYGAGANVYWTADDLWDILTPVMVSGVKGEKEETYHQGEVNLTAENIGALSTDRGGIVSGATTFSGNVKMEGKSVNAVPSYALGANAIGDVSLIDPSTYTWPKAGVSESCSKINVIDIRENDDLNDYKTAGFYRCISDSIAQTVKNDPFDNISFGLVVLDTSGSSYAQIAYVYSKERHIKYRSYYIGDAFWTDWSEIYTTANKPKELPSYTEYDITGRTFRYVDYFTGDTSGLSYEQVVTNMLKYICSSSSGLYAKSGDVFLVLMKYGPWNLVLLLITTMGSDGELPQYCQGMTLGYSPDMFIHFYTSGGALTVARAYTNKYEQQSVPYATTAGSATTATNANKAAIADKLTGSTSSNSFKTPNGQIGHYTKIGQFVLGNVIVSYAGGSSKPSSSYYFALNYSLPAAANDDSSMVIWYSCSSKDPNYPINGEAMGYGKVNIDGEAYIDTRGVNSKMTTNTTHIRIYFFYMTEN